MQLFNDASRTLNLYTNNTEVDYRSDEVTLDSILRVLTDRHPPGTARSRRLLSDDNSNVLVYITGHGGDEFMKIQVCSQHGVALCLYRHCLQQDRRRNFRQRVAFEVVYVDSTS